MKKPVEATVDEWKATGKKRRPRVKGLFKIDPSKKGLDEAQHKSFHRRVGELTYPAHRCRPDALWILKTQRVRCNVVS